MNLIKENSISVLWLRVVSHLEIGLTKPIFDLASCLVIKFHQRRANVAPIQIHYSKVHRTKKLALAHLIQLFERIGFKPALMKDIVKRMSAEGITDVVLATQHFIEDDRHVGGWRALLENMDPLERAVLHVVADKLPPLGKSTLISLSADGQQDPTIAKVRAALERLRKAGILTKDSGGELLVEDRLFAAFLQQQRPSPALGLGKPPNDVDTTIHLRRTS